MRRILMYITWMWLPFTIFAGSPQLAELLVDSDIRRLDTLFFELQGDELAAISQIRMHFLAGEDCYSGYLNGYRTDPTAAPFALQPNRLLGVTGHGLYQAARTGLDASEIGKIHAVLLRFVNRDHGDGYQQSAHFMGSCQDQTINCCIPIDCSESAGVCVVKYDMGVQPIIWPNHVLPGWAQGEHH